MSGKVVVRRYKYKNIATALAVLLLIVMGISKPINSTKVEKDSNSNNKVNSSIVSKDSKNDSKDEASSEAFSVGKLKSNYKYINIKNETEVISGDLLLLNSSDKFEGAMPTDLDGVYGYLFDKSGLQIGSTISTQVMGRKDMLNAFNKMLCDFYDETDLKTIMVSKLYESEDSNNDSSSQNAESLDSQEDTSSDELNCYEHDTGLAVDLQLYLSDQSAYPEFDGKGKYEWFVKNSWKYGFIQRYPENKSVNTGVEGMPNHFRYVGVVHAQAMYENNLCFEEYLNFIKKYSFDKPLSVKTEAGDGYAVYYVPLSDEKSTNYPIPLKEDDSEYPYEISGDNSNGVIICVKMLSADSQEVPTYESSDDSASSMDDSTQADSSAVD